MPRSTLASPHVIPPVAEVLQHPAFPTAIWTLVPAQSGLAPVAQTRAGGPFNISFEIHGTGPVKLVFIMGLGGLKSAWQRQTLHFGHEHGDRYSVLVLDNRGMGLSDTPLRRYSSSEMARDLVDVLSHVGWLPAADPPSTARTLHLVGISLGGMIAQELTLLIPSHVSSLSLVCTAAAIENTTSFAENMANRVSMLMPKSIDRAVRDTGLSLFPSAFLAAPDEAHLPDPDATPSCLPPGGGGGEEGAKYLAFPTNAHRFVAQEMHKRMDPARFGVKGFLLQLVAAGWHSKTPEQLAGMADAVGRERIMVMHGTEDRMISVPHGRKMVEYVKPGRALIIEGMGHGPLMERTVWFNGVIEEMVAVGEKLDGRA
ncbi:Alpha/Beta hydrolase protein [Schizothecium vesticola]|uniref:Alpha/Beta hydrolase protein n=1 Tax=Schizothecium vesticola TaxID=314040 RepID=A0AA40K8B4_9PEZI|nr:Alpha/Beta hydrolase protein [Schizothecium vesticola]